MPRLRSCAVGPWPVKWPSCECIGPAMIDPPSALVQSITHLARSTATLRSALSSARQFCPAPRTLTVVTSKPSLASRSPSLA